MIPVKLLSLTLRCPHYRLPTQIYTCMIMTEADCKLYPFYYLYLKLIQTEIKDMNTNVEIYIYIYIYIYIVYI